MAKKAACRCKHAECEECPEWIFTFADLVMLMMGFFVILWVLKPNPNPKTSSPAPSDYTDLVKAEASIREAFGYVPKAGSTDPVDLYMILQRAEQIKIPDGPGQGAKSKVKPPTPGSDPDPRMIRPGPQAMMGGRLQFDVADDKLTPLTQRTLDSIAVDVRGHRNLVMIKGHASLDDLPESATAAQLMALSIRRAEAVAEYLTSAGVAPELLRIQGCSTFEPVAVKDYDPSAQTTNRRVEVYTTPTLVTDLQGKPGEAGKNSTTQPMPK
jgi:outer membrane protein OmpA-like peptidoglycan-associated protein